MRLITITGPSGAGKDTVARMIAEKTGWNIICSYTTRPMREGEQEGRDHHFVKSCDVAHSEMLAYTQYGGYEYWTTRDQIKDTSIYVIDEDGLRKLFSLSPDFPMIHIYVESSKKTRRARGISEERMARDANRILLPESFYNIRINNSCNDRDKLQMAVDNTVTFLNIIVKNYDEKYGR